MALAACSSPATSTMPASAPVNSPANAPAASPTVTESVSTTLTSGSYVFLATDAALRPAIEKTANGNTMLVNYLYGSDPILQKEASASNTFAEAPSLSGLTADQTTKPRPGIILYDYEHWTSTPLSEQEHPAATIASGAATAHSGGFRFGVVPDMNFAGFRYLGTKSGCSFSLQSGIVPVVAWKNVDVLDVQIQRVASSVCSPNGNYQQLQSAMSQISSYVRAQNPNITIVAHFSDSEESAAQALAATNAIKNSINAVEMIYPVSSGANYSEPALLSFLQSI